MAEKLIYGRTYEEWLSAALEQPDKLFLVNQLVLLRTDIAAENPERRIYIDLDQRGLHWSLRESRVVETSIPVKIDRREGGVWVEYEYDKSFPQVPVRRLLKSTRKSVL